MLALCILSLAALAAASPAVSITDYVDALERRGGISTQELNEFKFYAQHSGAAYCNSDADPGDYVSCGDNVCPQVEANGVYVWGSAVGEDTGIGAYVGVDDVRQEIVLSVRGSNNIRNFITDIVFAKEDCDLVSGCELHEGFYDSWQEISDFAQETISDALYNNPGYTVTITGHSLGAAVATIAAAFLRESNPEFGTMNVYNYGSPRPGNAAFVNFVDRQPGSEFRVTHLDDPVPRLPPIIFNYAHTSPEYWLDDGSASTDTYGVNDIEVCVGITNTQCNAGTSIGLDITAHLNYFEPIAGCAPSPFQWKRSTQTVSNQQLATRLSNWAVQDQKYVASQ